MSLLNLTHKRLIKQINDANGLTLAYNQVNFSKPKVNTLTDRSTANTMIRTSPRNRSDYYGNRVMFYDRYDMADIAAMFGGVVYCPDAIGSTVGVLRYISAQYGIDIGMHEMQETVASEKDGDGNRTIVLTPTADNMFLIGTATVTLKTGPELAHATYTYDPSMYIVDSGKPWAEPYSFALDCSAEKTALSALALTDNDFGALAAALKRLTGHDWKASGPGQYSLQGAVVLRAGLNMLTWGVKTAFKYGVVIELAPECTGLSGQLLLGYN